MSHLWLSLGILPIRGLHLWLPDVMGNTITVHVRQWGLEREISSGEEVLGNVVLFPVVMRVI